MMGFASIGAMLMASLLAEPALAQNYPVTPIQRGTAEQVAQSGVPMAELAPSAPDSYTVKSGDTLWGISALYLARPWRWPELWGMNLQEIRNPHLIYPGQQLFLLKQDGRATLSTRSAGMDGQTVRVSPRTRYEPLSASALPTLSPSVIEPFLAEPVVVDEAALQRAPRIVATREDRVMLSKGDRAYGRGSPEAPLADTPGRPPTSFRVVRNAVPLKDPVSGEVLGYEAYYLGKAALLQGESTRETTDKDGKTTVDVVPASLDILSTREEIRVGDRLLPEPPRQLVSYTPHAPAMPIDARIVSVYGNAVQFAAQNQVVAISKGLRDGIESGHVLAILKNGDTVLDRTADGKELLKLPSERIGLLMVFRPFERVSYALVLEVTDTPRVGDLLANP